MKWKKVLSIFLCALLVAPIAAQDQPRKSQNKALDSKRAEFAPAVVRFPNLASQDATTWSTLPGLATVVTGALAPDGTNGAAKLSTSLPTEGGKRLHGSTRTISVGDWIIAGTWVKANSAASTLNGVTVATIRVDDDTAGYKFDVDVLNNLGLKASAKADTEWEWVTVAAKVAAGPAQNQGRLSFDLLVANNRSLSFYAPVLIHTRSGQVTDEEAQSLPQRLYAVPDGVSSGAVSSPQGQSIRQPGVQVNSDGSLLAQREKLFTRYSLKAEDDSLNSFTRLKTVGVPTSIKNLVTDFGAVNYAGETTGSMSSGSNQLTTPEPWHFFPGAGIRLVGAGPSGADLVTTIAAKNETTGVLTTAANANTRVSGAILRHDDTANLQAAVKSKGHVYLPAGFYVITSPIILPNTTGGDSLTIEGAGTGLTTILYQGLGSCFVQPATGTCDNWTFKNFSVTTSTPGDPFSVRPSVNRGSAFDFTGGALAVNVATFQNVLIAGWGRWGIIADNMQGGWIQNCIIRACNSGQIALMAEDTIWPASKEPNVCSIRDSQFDHAAYVNTPDVTRTDGAIGANSKTLTSATAGFTSDHEGRIVKVIGVGPTGGDLYATIKQVNSPTSVTLSTGNVTSSAMTGKTFTILKLNVANIFLQKAHHTSISSCIIQGNWASSPQNVSGIQAENSDGLVLSNLWIENSGGSAGFDISLRNTNGTSINGYHSNAAPVTANDFPGGNIEFISARATEIVGMISKSPTLHFKLDANSFGNRVSASRLSVPENVFNSFDSSPDGLTLDNNVVFEGDVASGNTGMYRGTGQMLDDWYGAQLLTNPRFKDGKTGYTDSQPIWWSVASTGVGRYDSYALVNTQSLSDEVVGLAFTQVVNIDDAEPAGPFVFGFDYLIESFGAKGAPGRELSFEVLGQNGAQGYGNFKITSFNSSNLPSGKWQRAQYSLYLKSGSSRSFTLRMFTSRGPNSPRVRIANLRLHRGQHVAWSHDQPVTEYAGGTLRKELRMVAQASPSRPLPGSFDLFAKTSNGLAKPFVKLSDGNEYELLTRGSGTVSNSNTILKPGLNSDGGAPPSAAPTGTAGTGAGTSPSLKIDGTQAAGAILITTGSSPATNAKIWEVRLAASFSPYPIVILQPGNAAAAAALADGRLFVSRTDLTGNTWMVKSGSKALEASTNYVFYYHALGW